MDSVKSLAYQDYLAGMKYKDIAEKYGVSLDTVKKWKTRYGWTKEGVHKKCTQNEKSVHTEICSNWLEIENEYVTDISRKPCTLEDLSVKYSIPYRTVRDYSTQNSWREKRKNFKHSASRKAAEKTEEITGMEIARVSARHLELSDKILDAVAEALSDKDELFKYVEVLRTGRGAGEFDDRLAEETLSAINNKKVVDLTKALKESQDIQRKALGILSPLEQHRIDHDKARLALEKQKIDSDSDSGKPIEITIKRATKTERENAENEA